ncbi:MAG: hypothetical protein ACOYM0_05880 [Bacteroidales bacterium]
MLQKTERKQLSQGHMKSLQIVNKLNTSRNSVDVFLKFRIFTLSVSG